MKYQRKALTTKQRADVRSAQGRSIEKASATNAAITTVARPITLPPVNYPADRAWYADFDMKRGGVR